MNRSVALIAPRGSYRTAAYLEAADRLGLEIVLVSEGDQPAAGESLSVELSGRGDATARRIDRTLGDRVIHGVVACDDSTLEIAAHLARARGLVHNPPAAVAASRDKALTRRALAAAKVATPSFRLVDLGVPIEPQLTGVDYPVVAKPLRLSASRGVIRADGADELSGALRRIAAILRETFGGAARGQAMVEQYLPGAEVAVEGFLARGRFTLLTIFDKPEPLEGPFFEESYYVTPSRHPATVRDDIVRTVERACRALGLVVGPIHAECRVNPGGVWPIEVATRTIGGECARLFRGAGVFAGGYGLEEMTLDLACGRPVAPRRPGGAMGVLMIPVPGRGVLRRVEGVLSAEQVEGVEEIRLDVREGQELVPWPEGDRYPGFVFARAGTPEQVEAALREANRRLDLVLAPVLPVVVGRERAKKTGLAAGQIR